MTGKVRETCKEPAAEKRKVVVQCPFCQDSFGILDRLSCPACSGKGIISVAEHTETCPVCRGKGPDGFRFYCLHCQRTSIIPMKEPAAVKGA
jgi:DnaJ-class molecular chaperone